MDWRKVGKWGAKERLHCVIGRCDRVILLDVKWMAMDRPKVIRWRWWWMNEWRWKLMVTASKNWPKHFKKIFVFESVRGTGLAQTIPTSHSHTVIHPWTVRVNRSMFISLGRRVIFTGMFTICCTRWYSPDNSTASIQPYANFIWSHVPEFVWAACGHAKWKAMPSEPGREIK